MLRGPDGIGMVLMGLQFCLAELYDGFDSSTMVSFSTEISDGGREVTTMAFMLKE
jgi:hypothetical protein